MKIKSILIALGVTTISSLSLTVQAASVESGRDAFEACRGCHTSPGASNVYPTYYVPKIGGQVSGYTVSALKAYRDASRPHGTMMANTIDLSDQTIEDIAAYLASAAEGSKRAISNHGNIANGKKLSGACMGCHNDDDTAGASNPRLAGQHANYLEKAMQQYKSGARPSPLMQSMLQTLSNEDIKDLAAYFTSLKSGLTTVK